jgi:hypothetical protein
MVTMRAPISIEKQKNRFAIREDVIDHATQWIASRLSFRIVFNRTIVMRARNRAQNNQDQYRC